MRVLVIEDDASIAANLYDFLESAGYEVDMAASGPAGLKRAVSQPWGAIVVDLSLPGMGRHMLCRKLRD